MSVDDLAARLIQENRDETMGNCNLHENQRKAGTLCRSMHCRKCPPYREEKPTQIDTPPPIDHDAKYLKFTKELREVVNRNSMENYCNIPDFLIAEYLTHCFSGLCGIKTKNDKWHK